MNTENQNIEFKESWGRGWQKICDGFMAAGLPKPSIESKQGGVLVTFQRNNVNLNATGVEGQESTQKEGAFEIMPNKGNEEEKTTQETQQKNTLESTLESGLKSVQESEEKTTQKTQQKSTLKSGLKSSLESGLKSSLKSGLKSEQSIIEAIIANPNVTIPILQEMTGLSRNGIKKALNRLKVQGIIRRVGPDKGGHWELLQQS